jgi:hypothetical protein
MKHHNCQLPSVEGRTAWTCPDCRWTWRVHPVVKQWFRDLRDG